MYAGNAMPEKFFQHVPSIQTTNRLLVRLRLQRQIIIIIDRHGQSVSHCSPSRLCHSLASRDKLSRAIGKFLLETTSRRRVGEPSITSWENHTARGALCVCKSGTAAATTTHIRTFKRGFATHTVQKETRIGCPFQIPPIRNVIPAHALMR